MGGLDEHSDTASAGGNQVDELSELLYEHYVRPTAENDTMRKVSAAMHHELTCGDLSHMHGAVKVKWETQDE